MTQPPTHDPRDEQSRNRMPDLPALGEPRQDGRTDAGQDARSDAKRPDAADGTRADGTPDGASRAEATSADGTGGNRPDATGSGSSARQRPVAGESRPIPPRTSQQTSSHSSSSSSSSSRQPWNGPGASHSNFQPGSYAGQSHSQFGRPSQSQGSASASSGSPTAGSPTAGSQTSGLSPQHAQSQSQSSYGRPTPQPYRGGAPTTHYGNTTSQYGAPLGATSQTMTPQTEAESKKEKKRGRGARATVVIMSLLLPIGIAAGLFAGYLYADQFGSFNTDAVEREVVAVLRDDYGLSDLSEVECPTWIKVEQGESFQCEFEYAGAEQTVTVTQGSQSGQLVVGAPE